jgi:hypothetical protein
VTDRRDPTGSLASMTAKITGSSLSVTTCLCATCHRFASITQVLTVLAVSLRPIFPLFDPPPWAFAARFA